MSITVAAEVLSVASLRDVVIVGAGPAGLAAARACLDLGLDVELVEQGKDIAERDKDASDDVAKGLGGAGLFSDGKFSFYPSATKLWHLQPRKDLIRAYQWFSALVRLGGLEPEPLPEMGNDTIVLPSIGRPFGRKHYPSQYMPFTQRLRLIKDLANLIPAIKLLTRLTQASFDDKVIQVTTEKANHERVDEAYRAMVFSGGRFGPLLVAQFLPKNSQIFRRIEVGIRIEQEADEFFLQNEEGIDPKFIAVAPDVPCDWRTFCCCRNGLVVASVHDGLLSLSGRADCPPTGKSNVGFNLRITDEALARTLWPEMLERLLRLKEPIIKSVQDPNLPNAIHEAFGKVTPLLLRGVDLLREQFQISLADARIYAPTIEGIGNYPRTDQTLRVQPYPLWIAGDASGTFRGLTAALVSGYYIGLQVGNYLGSKR